MALEQGEPAGARTHFVTVEAGGLFFGMEPRFWLNLQSEYDIRIADRELRAKLSPRIRVFQPAAV